MVTDLLAASIPGLICWCGGGGGGRGGGGVSLLAAPLLYNPSSGRRRRSGTAVLRVAAAAAFHDRNNQNHYVVLGVPRSATSGAVKKAYRLLARKWHPDVNKDKQAGEVFKSVRLAYEVLSDDGKRSQYDSALWFDEETERTRRNSHHSSQFTSRVWYTMWDGVKYATWDGVKYTMWDGVRLTTWEWDGQWKQTQKDRNQKPCSDNEYNLSDEERGEAMRSFARLLISALFSLLLMRTVGCRMTLTISGLMALADPELDGGCKLGYLVSWYLGDVRGILLTTFLSFMEWDFGKTSSGIGSQVVLLTLWAGWYVVKRVPLPLGAFLVLLFISVAHRDSL